MTTSPEQDDPCEHSGLSPRWLFRCAPHQFRAPGLCSGIFFLPGVLFWAALHLTAVWLVLFQGIRDGEWLWPGVSVAVLVPLWALFVAADTLIGPAYFAVGAGEQGSYAVYIYLGRPY